jgi:hypothetical protein
MGVMNMDGTHNYAATKSAVEFAAEREIKHIDPDEAWKETEEEMIAADHAAIEHADELIAAADKEHEKTMKELKQKEEKQLAADEKDRDAYQAKHDAITAEEAQREAVSMKALSLSSALTAFENAGGKKEDFANAIVKGARDQSTSTYTSCFGDTTVDADEAVRKTKCKSKAKEVAKKANPNFNEDYLAADLKKVS